MKDQLIMTALFQQNAKVAQQNPSTTLTINSNFWAPDCQSIHVYKILVFDHLISLSTELHGHQHGKILLCYWVKLILEQTKALTLCSWRQLLNPQRALLKYIHVSLRASSHGYDDRWPKKPEFLPAHSSVLL